MYKYVRSILYFLFIIPLICILIFTFYGIVNDPTSFSLFVISNPIRLEDWLTLVLIVITGSYAWLTFRILKTNEAAVAAMQSQTEAQLRPYVVVYVSPRIGTTYLELEIHNKGRSPALGLRLKLDKDFFSDGEDIENKNLAKLLAFTENIESLAPDTRLRFKMGFGYKIFGAEVDETICPRVFCVRAEYNFGGKCYIEENKIDVRPILQSGVIVDPIAEELKKHNEILLKIKEILQQ